MNQSQEILINELFERCNRVFYQDTIETNIHLDEKSAITGVNYNLKTVNCSLNDCYSFVDDFPIKFLSDEIIDKIIKEIERKIDSFLAKKHKFEDGQYCDIL